MDLLRQHLEEVERIFTREHTAGRRFRVLSDLRGASVQLPDVAGHIEGFSKQAFEPSDKIAVVVASNLLKLQMRRVVHRARFEAFLSVDAAERWLGLDDAGHQQMQGPLERAPRLTTSIVTSASGSDGVPLTVRIRNVSSSGLLLDGQGRHQAGETIQISLPEIGAVTGRIVRTRGSFAGIRFDRPIDIDKMGLR
jgi:hypothetical protein